MYISYALFILYGPANVAVCDLSENIFQSELEKIVALRGLLFWPPFEVAGHLFELMLA